MGRTYAEVLARHARGARAWWRSHSAGAPSGFAADYGVVAEPTSRLRGTARYRRADPGHARGEIRLPQAIAAARAGKHVLGEAARTRRGAGRPDDRGLPHRRCDPDGLPDRALPRHARARQAAGRQGRIGKVLQIRSYAMGTRQDFADFVS
ncbi:MAG: hypothetical protein U0Z44_20780 [Kouleothrix sp.]